MPLDRVDIQAMYHQTKQDGEHVLAGYDRATSRSFENAPTPFFNWLQSPRTRKVNILLHTSPHMGTAQHTRMTHMAALITWIATSWDHHVGATLSQTGTTLPFQPHFVQSLLHHALSPRHGPPALDPLDRCLTAMHRAYPDRCVLVLLSDFIEPNWESPLYALSQTHYVLPVVIHDPPPAHWPGTTLLPVTHPVSGHTQWVNPQDPPTRVAIQRAWDTHTNRLTQTFRLCHLTPLYLCPHTPYHTILLPPKRCDHP